MPSPRWGLPPVWGFADVIGSTMAGVVAGQRFYGYLPPAAALVFSSASSKTAYAARVGHVIQM